MKRTILGLALAAILPVSAQASELSYSYIEGSYVSTDFVDEDFNGFGIAGSVEFGKNWYGHASYRTVDNNDFDLDLNETIVGIGYHHAMNDKADVIAELDYINLGAEFDGDSGDSNGYRASVGFRGMMAPKFEGNIKASYTDISDMDGEFGVSVGGQYHINTTWGIVGSYEHTTLLEENTNTWTIGLRASF